jgi:hypothetical protein
MVISMADRASPTSSGFRLNGLRARAHLRPQPSAAADAEGLPRHGAGWCFGLYAPTGLVLRSRIVALKRTSRQSEILIGLSRSGSLALYVQIQASLRPSRGPAAARRAGSLNGGTLALGEIS